jgi:hypothetical protein
VDAGNLRKRVWGYFVLGAAITIALGLSTAARGGAAPMSKAQYTAVLLHARQSLTKSVGVLNTSVKFPLPRLARSLLTAEQFMTPAIEELARAKPPAAVENDNAQLVSALRYDRGVLKRMRQAALAGDLRGVLAAAAAGVLSPVVTRGEKANNDLRRKGYPGLYPPGGVTI